MTNLSLIAILIWAGRLKTELQSKFMFVFWEVFSLEINRWLADSINCVLGKIGKFIAFQFLVETRESYSAILQCRIFLNSIDIHGRRKPSFISGVIVSPSSQSCNNFVDRGNFGLKRIQIIIRRFRGLSIVYVQVVPKERRSSVICPKLSQLILIINCYQ